MENLKEREYKLSASYRKSLPEISLRMEILDRLSFSGKIPRASENQVGKGADNQQADDGPFQKDEEQLRQIDRQFGAQNQAPHFI